MHTSTREAFHQRRQAEGCLTCQYQAPGLSLMQDAAEHCARSAARVGRLPHAANRMDSRWCERHRRWGSQGPVLGSTSGPHRAKISQKRRPSAARRWAARRRRTRRRRPPLGRVVTPTRRSRSLATSAPTATRPQPTSTTTSGGPTRAPLARASGLTMSVRRPSRGRGRARADRWRRRLPIPTRLWRS